MSDPAPSIPPIIPQPPRPLLPQQEKFAQLIAAGNQFAASYRLAYGRPKATRQQAADRVREVMNGVGVRQRIIELRKNNEGTVLLTLNERLSILARGAARKIKSAADLNAAARAIEVYSKISGDQAPERQEVVHSGNSAAPLTVVTRAATKSEKIAALLAARTARTAAAAAEQATPPTALIP